ncbi:MAG: CBS domain-containing protein [Guyparkeria sp.]|uniref:CBS domain-containing protein n=1 Tax=Guyparkeria sp. TaxID=2035736 RepID=UPI0039797173
MKASDWLAAHPADGVTLSPEATLPEAAAMFLAHPEVRDLYVVDADGRVVGHLGFRRLAGLLLAHLRPTHSRRQLVERVTAGCVREHMDDHVLCMRPDERISEVLHHHMERRIEDIPVVDADRRLLGVIRVADLLRKAIDQAD